MHGGHYPGISVGSGGTGIYYPLAVHAVFGFTYKNLLRPVARLLLINGGGVLLILITRLRYKIMSLIRVLLALAILAILFTQLFGLIREAGNYYDEWFSSGPRGNPMKVFQNMF